MATLDDARKKIAGLLQEMEATHNAYTIAAETYNKFAANKAMDMTEISMFMQIYSAKIQLPLPFDPQEVADRVAAGCNLLAGEMAKQWDALFNVARETCEYIQRAQSQAALHAVPAANAGAPAASIVQEVPASVATAVVAMHTVPAT